jgi:hypothetical protein
MGISRADLSLNEFGTFLQIASNVANGPLRSSALQSLAMALPKRNNTQLRHQRVAVFEFRVACWAKPQKMQQVLRTCQRRHMSQEIRGNHLSTASQQRLQVSLCSDCLDHLGSVRPVLKMHRLTPHTAEIGTGKEIRVFSQLVRADRPQHHPQIADANI